METLRLHDTHLAILNKDARMDYDTFKEGLNIGYLRRFICRVMQNDGDVSVNKCIENIPENYYGKDLYDMVQDILIYIISETKMEDFLNFIDEEIKLEPMVFYSLIKRVALLDDYHKYADRVREHLHGYNIETMTDNYFSTDSRDDLVLIRDIVLYDNEYFKTYATLRQIAA